MMRVAIRADASFDIGSGHVARCLALAHGWRVRGAEVVFICRQHEGHLCDLIGRQGFGVLRLARPEMNFAPASGSAHVAWLGAGWREDMEETVAALDQASVAPDWLVADHYGIDARWETGLRSRVGRIMVIDDLADRPHDCDVLLDQNLGRAAADYLGRLPDACEVLTGPQFALLRPEFAAYRERSLARRIGGKCRRVLVSMGGVDRPNATGAALAALRACRLPAGCSIVVILGAACPWINEVSAVAADMPWPTEVWVNVDEMARVMSECDLALGAAGGSAWERCCLGLPSVLVVMAGNQRAGAAALDAVGAARLVGEVGGLAERLPAIVSSVLDRDQLALMGSRAAGVVDGLGVGRVIARMEACDV